jgi:plastocyanin
MKHAIVCFFTFSLFAAPALADNMDYALSIKDHRFEPATLEIPADTKVKLVVKNLDATAEEFESHDFNREKVIAGGSEASIFVGPLKAGEYRFFGEFHEKTAQGKLIVK